MSSADPAAQKHAVLTAGLAVERTHTVVAADLDAFAAVSGDSNPLHLDEAYAAATAFKGRVAHGMLLGAWISAVLGTELPGPGAIYVSQTLSFKRPVRIGDEVVTRVEVASVDARAGQVVLATRCTVRGKLVVDGEALVRPPRDALPRPPATSAPGPAEMA